MQIYVHINDLGWIKIRSLIHFFACAQSFHLLKNLKKDDFQSNSFGLQRNVNTLKIFLIHMKKIGSCYKDT